MRERGVVRRVSMEPERWPVAAAMAAAERQALEAVGRSATEGGFATPVEFSNV